MFEVEAGADEKQQIKFVWPNREFDSGSKLTCRKESSRLNSSVVYLVDGVTATQPVNDGVLHGLTQEQEGTYTCEYNNQFSNNITLAGIY